jgi:hypothetical protein
LDNNNHCYQEKLEQFEKALSVDGANFESTTSIADLMLNYSETDSINDALGYHEENIDDNFNNPQRLLKHSGLLRQTKIGNHLVKDVKTTPGAIRNQALIDKYNIPAPPDSAKCQGAAWKHGTIPCSYIHIFNGTIENPHLASTAGRVHAADGCFLEKRFTTG